MQIRNWLSVMSMGVAAIGCSGTTIRKPGPDPDRLAQCRKAHENWEPRQQQNPNQQPGYKLPTRGFGFGPVTPVFIGGGDCPDIGGCGLNGSWLGSGVQFRTLHLTAGVPNEQGLQIKEFRKWDPPHVRNELLRIDVQGQDLVGYRAGGGVVAGTDLYGAEIVIEHVSPLGIVDTTYTLKIEPLKPAPVEDFRKFWANCADGSCPAEPHLYQFTATSSDGCEVKLCKPGLGDDYHGGLTGTAVIFRGDLYSDANYSVALPTPNSYDGDVFNIACTGTTISKLHLMRHTTATGSSARPTAVVQRTAMLKAFAGDYCGIGVPFTKDGLPIALNFKHADYGLVGGSPYAFHDADTIDAPWTDKGALCIDQSRVLRIPVRERTIPLVSTDAEALRHEIVGTCAGRGGLPSTFDIPACSTMTGGPITPATLFPFGNYATTGNPAAAAAH